MTNIKKIFTLDLLMAIALSIFFTAAFFVYLYFVGVPLTQAKNHLNQGIIYYEQQDYDRAAYELDTSLKYWKTPEAEAYINQVRDNINKHLNQPQELTPETDPSQN